MPENLNQEKKAFYLTTPIYYVNDIPHIATPIPPSPPT
jgi:methionyl-tRNA synthetase